MRDFFLPKLGLSIKYNDTIKLGAYPNIVRIYDVKFLFSLPKIKGKTVSCP